MPFLGYVLPSWMDASDTSCNKQAVWLLCYEIEKSGPFNSLGALLVCSQNMFCSCLKDILLHSCIHTRLMPRNYFNLMPHSPLLILNSVHIFSLVLNEGAVTCFTPNKRQAIFILHLGQCGWVVVLAV